MSKTLLSIDGNAPLEKISRVQAAEESKKRYYTGDNCIHGHDSERFVSNGMCCACNQKVNRQRYDAFRANPRGTILVKVRVHKEDERQIQDTARIMRAARGLK